MAEHPGLDDEVGTGPVIAVSELQTPSEEVLELEHVYEALAHPRRRYLCYLLLAEPVWTLTELAAEIAAREDGSPDAAVDDGDLERVCVSLYHAHVPKLVDWKVVSFDEETETVAIAENAEQVLDALVAVGATLEETLESETGGDRADEKR